MSQKAVIFDLDGTLLDTIDDIKNAMNHALTAHQLPNYNTEEYKLFIGEGLRVLGERAVPEAEHHQLDSVINHFKEYYKDHCADMTRPYDGIDQLLVELSQRNILLAVLSNKPHLATVQVIADYFPNTPFKVVAGQKDEIPRKPDAAGALLIADELGLETDQCYFVGDTKIDILTAVNSNMNAVGVTWGFREKAELLEAGAQYLINSPVELLDILNG